MDSRETNLSPWGRKNYDSVKSVEGQCVEIKDEPVVMQGQVYYDLADNSACINRLDMDWVKTDPNK